MKTEIMTVHEALSEIKVISKRITGTLMEMKVVTANRKNASKINGTIEKMQVRLMALSLISILRKRKPIFSL